MDFIWLRKDYKSFFAGALERGGLLQGPQQGLGFRDLRLRGT